MPTALAARMTAATIAAALLAGLVVVTTAAPVAAQPLCDGKVATIVGTPGDDDLAHGAALFGTPDDDVIVGLGGVDDIFGLNGNDAICGGSGRDNIEGGPGEDVIFGGGHKDTIDGGDDSDIICGDQGPDEIKGGFDGDFIAGGPGNDQIWGEHGIDFLAGYKHPLIPTCTSAGADGRDRIRGGSGPDSISGGPGPDILFGQGLSDTIRGGPGNDRIDGGPAFDDCAQNAGTGLITNCEVADLQVRVIAPASPADADGADFKVVVTNRGPGATSYTLIVDEENMHAECNPPWEAVKQGFPALAPGKKRTRTYTEVCVIEGEGPWAEVDAEVDARARDPRPGNNKHTSPRVDIE